MKICQTQGRYNTNLFYITDHNPDISVASILTFFKTHRLHKFAFLIAGNDYQQITSGLFDRIFTSSEVHYATLHDADVLILLPAEPTTKVLQRLKLVTAPSTLTIDLTALTHNYQFFTSYLGKDKRIIPMLKANAYGMGSQSIGKHLEVLGATHLATVFTDEGVLLRQVGIRANIMVMQPQPNDLERLFEHQLQPTFSNKQTLQSFIQLLSQQKIIDPYPIHLKVETGFNRTGIKAVELPEIFDLISDHQSLVSVQTILSHLSNGDDPDGGGIFTQKQHECFEAIKQQCHQMLERQPEYHLLTSRSILNFAHNHDNTCFRLGLGLHGFFDQIDKGADELIPIAELHSRIIQISQIEADEIVSYGAKFKATKPMTVATVPIGYADFMGRAWGNEKGFVAINGQKAVIVGTMCMDLLMVDVSDIVCKIGDSVEVFGPHVPLESIAQACRTICHEVLVSINPNRVDKVYKYQLS